MNAIRSYIMAEKASKSVKSKDKKLSKDEQQLDSAAIASINQGLTGSDSVNAIRSYVMAAKAKSNKKGKKQAVTNPLSPEIASNSTILDNTDSTSTTSSSSIHPTVESSKPVKTDKKKKKAVETVVIAPTEDSTLLYATRGLSGADSINAIRQVRLAEKKNNNKKKEKKPEQIVQTNDSTLAPLSKVEETPAPIVTTKKEKKKKNSQPSEKVIADTSTTIHSFTSNDNPIKSIQTTDSASSSSQAPSNLTEDTKKERRKKTGAVSAIEKLVKDTATTLQIAPSVVNKQETDTTKNSLPPIVKDTAVISHPIEPSIEKKPFRKRLKVVAPPSDDNTKQNLILDSTSNKLPKIDSLKK
jgi:hypothetical protein